MDTYAYELDHYHKKGSPVSSETHGCFHAQHLKSCYDIYGSKTRNGLSMVLFLLLPTSAIWSPALHCLDLWLGSEMHVREPLFYYWWESLILVDTVVTAAAGVHCKGCRKLDKIVSRLIRCTVCLSQRLLVQRPSGILAVELELRVHRAQRLVISIKRLHYRYKNSMKSP